MILPIRCDLLTGGAPSHMQSKLAGEEVQLAETRLPGSMTRVHELFYYLEMNHKSRKSEYCYPFSLSSSI